MEISQLAANLLSAAREIKLPDKAFKAFVDFSWWLFGAREKLCHSLPQVVYNRLQILIGFSKASDEREGKNLFTLLFFRQLKTPHEMLFHLILISPNEDLFEEKMFFMYV